MSEADIKRLFTEIAMVYPSFEKNLGNLKIVQAWHQRLLGMSETTAMKILDNHLAGENGDRAPTLSTFVRKMETMKESFVDSTPHQYRINPTDPYTLLDEDDREYGNQFEEPYYCNELGYICRMHEGHELVVAR